MEELLRLINEFEERNNISTSLTLCGDGSSTLFEFWDDEILKSSNSQLELFDFLKETKYKQSEDGRCLSPVQIDYLS